MRPRDPRKQKYPPDSDAYKSLEEIGRGVHSFVYKAKAPCKENQEESSVDVAIKVIDLRESKASMEEIDRLATFTTCLNHPNLRRAHCFFRVDKSLWVVMPFMSCGSLQSIIASSYPDGLPEACIAAVLENILHGLSHLHSIYTRHGDIKPANILVDSNGSLIKLADYGVSASVYDSSPSSSSSSSTLMSGTRYWVAPEVIRSPDKVHGFKSDIWSFGITALELAHGRPPLSHLSPSKSLMLKCFKMSKSFKNMVGQCLDHDPFRRPSASGLKQHPFFKNCPRGGRGPILEIKNVAAGKKIELLTRQKCEEAGEKAMMNKGGDVGIRGWKLDEEWLELDAVYDDAVVAPQETAVSGEELQRELVRKILQFLLDGIDYQKQKAQQVIAFLRAHNMTQ